MPKRNVDSGEPGTSSSGHDESPEVLEGLLESQTSSDGGLGEPAAKKLNLDIKQETIESLHHQEQSGALILESKPTVLVTTANIKRENEEILEELLEDDDEASRSPMVDEEEDYDDAESVIDKTDIPSLSEEFVNQSQKCQLPEDVMIGAWEMYCHAFQRVSLVGSEQAWQVAAIYYFLLSNSIKRRGKPGRLLLQPFPVSIVAVAQAFDVSIIEMLDKTLRFVEIIQSRKMRRYLEYIRRIQEALAVSCVIFKKFVRVYCEMFVEVTSPPETVPSSHDVFTVLWTAFLILKTRLPSDDLVSNYQMMFSMFDQFYTEMCSEKEGVVHHLDQSFVSTLLRSDMSIVRALCLRFGGNVLDAKQFYDHSFKKMNRAGIPLAWDFAHDRDGIMSTVRATYDDYIQLRGGIDERVFIPDPLSFPEIFKTGGPHLATTALRSSKSGEPFKDAEFLNQIANKQCLEKLSISNQKEGAEKLAAAREQPRVPCVDFDLELGAYPDDKDSCATHQRLKRIIGIWRLEKSRLKEVCENMCDNPMATLLLKCDELTMKFERKLAESLDGVASTYHHQMRMELEKLFLMFLEKIIVAELRKGVKEEDLLNVIRREDFLDSVMCFCVELTLFGNGYRRPFPWSSELCDCHPFLFHRIIDLMITHEKRLSRPMVKHFNQIEESVIDYFAWKWDSPLWELIQRLPLSHFHEFGDDLSDKINFYSPTKFTPIKGSDEYRDELGRPIVPHNQTGRTLRLFLKRTFFTAARRLQELTDRVAMGVRAKSQCWSLFDYLLRQETIVFMDHHLDQILLCSVYVVMKLNNSDVMFSEIMAQYRRQSKKDAEAVYRNVTMYTDQPDNPRESIQERLTAERAGTREKQTVDLIQYYNMEFRDRVRYIVGQIESASDEDLMEMPIPTSYGLMPVKMSLTDNVCIQMLPKTPLGDSREEMVIASIEEHGHTVDLSKGFVSVPALE